MTCSRGGQRTPKSEIMRFLSQKQREMTGKEQGGWRQEEVGWGAGRKAKEVARGSVNPACTNVLLEVYRS